MDRDKMLDLPDEEFKEEYLEKMQSYAIHWEGGKGGPTCDECMKKIPEMNELRKFYGLNLHPNCFSKRLDEDITNGEVDAPDIHYWRKIDQLLCNPV